ncbi:hypothetical protein ACP70R_032348 [Stipagrostis hirtigluma subsp. patula]
MAAGDGEAAAATGDRRQPHRHTSIATTREQNVPSGGAVDSWSSLAAAFNRRRVPNAGVAKKEATTGCHGRRAVDLSACLGHHGLAALLCSTSIAGPHHPSGISSSTSVREEKQKTQETRNYDFEGTREACCGLGPFEATMGSMGCFSWPAGVARTRMHQQQPGY